MKKIFILLFIANVLMNTGIAFSQDKLEFSLEPESFILEFSTFINSNMERKNADETALVGSAFIDNWVSGRFNEVEKQAIILCSILLKEENLAAYPFFINFASCLNNLKTHNQTEYSLRAWLKGLEMLLGEKNNTKLQAHVNASLQFLSEKIIYTNNGLKWGVENDSFTFDFDKTILIRFENIDLKCSTKNDSSVIKNTSGIYFPLDKVWHGRGGIINWMRFGDSLKYVTLSKYEINTRLPQYNADSVVFRDDSFVSDPFIGSFTEKILASPPGSQTSYPRFTAYLDSYFIEDIYQDINYEGGLKIEGFRYHLFSEKNSDVRLEFFNKDTMVVQCISKEFVINSGRIIANRCSVKIPLGQDSIYHPGLKLKYSNMERSLVLLKIMDGLMKNPFFDSYHKIDIYSDALTYKLDSTKIIFGRSIGIKNESEAIFESANFFSDYDYYRLQGIDLVHPLIKVKKYCMDYNTNSVSLGAFSEYIKKPMEQTSALLFNLAARGFLTYDVENKKARVKQRLSDYLLSKAKLLDYDVFRFYSKVQSRSNASLDMSTFDLTIYGVDKVALSDSQHVVIYPFENTIVMRQNRDFVFSGKVDAGLFTFDINEGYFQYDEFKINLPIVDSMSLKVKANQADKDGKFPLMRVKNVLADLSGFILIDHPDNKSGLKSYPEYPKFSNSNEAFVYYDDSLIANGQYNRKDFYFYVEPFAIDSLDNFSTSGLKFKGYLASNGLFPPITEDLSIMPDYSMGFVHQTPQEGYPIYNGMGIYRDRIELSNEGLKGKGSLSYLTSKTNSAQFSFYVDSLIADKSELFEIGAKQASPEFPEVKGDLAKVLWHPYKDSMLISTGINKFKIFDAYSELSGNLILRPDRLIGNGLFTFGNAELASNQFDFGHHTVNSDTTDLNLYTDSYALSFSAENYQTYMDLSMRKGLFKSNGQLSVLNFPFNNYVSTMDEIEWEMDNHRLLLSNNLAESIPGLDQMNRKELVDIDLSGSKFISTRPDQDSLSFYSLRATYDMTNFILYAEDVKYINVADVAVFPSDGKVTIMQNAQMPTLNNAGILANRQSKNFEFYHADVNIFSSKNYVASGSVDYIDALGTPQEIKLSTIKVDSLGSTYAVGEIPDSEIFFLSPNYYYSGSVRINANEPFMIFNGGYSLNHECFFTEPIWVKFIARIDPLNVRLPVDDNLVDINQRRLDIGLFYSVNDGKLYPAVFTPKVNPTDRTIINVRGLVEFDERKQSYNIGSSNILDEKSLQGDNVHLNIERCILSGEGRLQLVDDLNKVELMASGNFEHLIIPDSTSFRAMMSLDFMFDNASLNMFADSLGLSNQRGVNLNSDYYKSALSNLIGSLDAQKVLEDMQLYGVVRNLPKSLEKSIILSDVKLDWDPVERAFISYGEIGVGMINGKQINKYMNGVVKVNRSRSGQSVDIYLEINPSHYYFFSYKNKVMQALSSDRRFNERILEVNPDARAIKESGVIQYEFVTSTRQKLTTFLREVKY